MVLGIGSCEIDTDGIKKTGEERNNAEFMEIAVLKSARLQKIKTLRCCGLERMKIMKQVQISEDLFMLLLKYHFIGIEEYQPEIQKGLEQKLDQMVKRQLYTTYKTAPTEEEREKARKEYLDKRGVSEDFRW